MQRNRPKTTKLSFSVDSSNRIARTSHAESDNFPFLNDKLKKWQQIAQQANRQIYLSTFARRGRSAHQPLQKMGGKSFELKPVAITASNTIHVNATMNRPTTSMKQNEKSKTIIAFQRYRNSEKSRANLKRTSRQYVDTKANVQYDRMVLKIGSNIQHEQKFNMYYIQNIRKVQIIEPTPMPIVYGIKSQTQSYNACMTSFKNEQMPICISLFTESFHAKYQQSMKKKKQYIAAMLKTMNGTYDPEIMSRMAIVHKKRDFDQKEYFTVVAKFKTGICCQQKKILDRTMQKIKGDKLGKYEKQGFRINQLQNQAVQSFKQALAITNLDYYLKDPQNLSHLPLRQYLPSQKEYISSFRICYHGGYSKHLYNSWSSYYKHGRTELPKKISKLSPQIQKVNSWIQSFSNILFIQDQLFTILLSPISIQQMSTIQQIKTRDSFSIFKNLCIKGVMTILQEGRFLYVREGEYQGLTRCPSRFQYLEGRDLEGRGLHVVEELGGVVGWYEQYLQNRHQKKVLTSITDLVQVPLICPNQQLCQPQHNQINKSLNILLNIFYQQLLTHSLTKLTKFFLNPSKPSIKLNLIVDRQSLKLHETQETIIHAFTKIINDLTKETISCTSAGLRLEDMGDIGMGMGKGQFPEYGNLGMMDVREETMRVNCAWGVQLEYKGVRVEDACVKEFISKIRQWYHQAQGVIQHFGCFMPFIKLTAKQKIFSQDLQLLQGLSQWQQAKQLFIINRDKVHLYKQKLASTPIKFSIGIFQVDCSQPQKILRDRISQLQYLFQQKYLSKIFTKIHEMQQELAKIMSLLHSFNIKTNKVEDISQMLEKSKEELRDVKNRTKDLASHIYFYIDKAKSSTLIARFAQLINKRRELLGQIEELKVRIRQDSLQLQCRRQQQRQIFHTKVCNYSQKLTQFCHEYLQLQKWPKHKTTLTTMLTQLHQLHSQFTEVKDPNCQYEQQEQLYTIVRRKIEVVYRYWMNVWSFYGKVRELDLLRIREICQGDFGEYQGIVRGSLGTIGEFQGLGVDVNQINLVSLHRYKQQILKHNSCLFPIKILANKEISLQYYSLFSCQSLLNMPFRDLLNLPNWSTYEPILIELEIKAKTQQEIYRRFCEIQRKFQEQKLVIIDLHGCDTLDPDLTSELARTLRDQQFKCQILHQSRYSYKYTTKISQLESLMKKCEQIIIKWLQIETKYIQLQAYYKYNDDGFYKDNFKWIADCHRKIIKSFDMDNSVVLLPKNGFLVASLDTLLGRMADLKRELFGKFNQLQSTTCRLQLLTHEELLQMMSFVKTIPKHLPKCLPTISNIGLSQQSIQRIGGYSPHINTQPKPQTLIGNYIFLKQPINLTLRLCNISTWLQKLLNDIKQVMKHEFTQSEKRDRDTCVQVVQLKEQIFFTEEMEEILGSQEDQVKKLQICLHSLERRMQDKAKITTHKYNTQMLLLLLIMERDIVSSLLQAQQSTCLSKDSFQWIKNARFYSHQPPTQAPKKPQKSQPNIKMQIIGQCYPYNFMFIQKCEMIVQDVLFVGNCIIGQKGIGKKSIIKHYAYMTGNQLFMFERDRISSNFTENIVNFYKLAITTGGWLLIPEVDSMSSEEMRTIGECFNYLSHAISAKLSKMEIFVYNQFSVNDNCRVFFTLQNFNSIPTRLAHNFRPIWLCAPSLQFISSVCNQVANMVDNRQLKRQPNNPNENINFTFKIIDFIHWNRTHEDIPLYLAQSMLQHFQKPLKACQHYTNNNFLNLLIHTKFLLPQDIGYQNIGEDNIDWILENCPFSVFYMERKDFNRFMCSNFGEETYVELGLSQADFGHLRQAFCYLRRVIRRSQIKYIFLEESLKNYRKIQAEMKDQDLAEANIKVIYLQNIANLQKEACIRIHAHYPTVVLSNPKPKPKSNAGTNQNAPKFKKIGFKSISLNQQQCSQLQPAYQTILTTLISTHLQNQTPTANIHQLQRNFSKLYTKLLSQKYHKQISFIFAVGWVFGNVISQKNIIAELNRYEGLFKCAKVLKYCVNIRELCPRKGDFGGSDGGEMHRVGWNQGVLKFRSCILSNLKFIRDILSDENMVISSEHSVSQILTTLFPQSFHLYPTDLPNPITSKNLLQHTLKIKSTQKYPKFVIHSMQRLPPQVYTCISSFIEKGTILYKEGQELKTFKERKCQFTVSMGGRGRDQGMGWAWGKDQGKDRGKDQGNFNGFKIQLFDQEILGIQIDQLQGIREASSKTYIYDDSICKGLINFYRMHARKYWFQHPIPPTYKKWQKQLHTRSLSTTCPKPPSFFLSLLRHQLLSIPSQKSKLLNQICYNSSTTTLTYNKSQQIQYQIKTHNSTQVYKIIQGDLMEGEIQGRRRICRDVVVMNQSVSYSPYWYQMMYRTYLAISAAHTVLIGGTFTQRYYCLETVAKILNISIIPYNPAILNEQAQQCPMKKNILLLNHKDITQQALTALQSLIPQQNSTLNINYHVVLKLDQQNPETEQLYRAYPFLKKYFIHVNFVKNQKEDIMRSINLVKTLKNLENGENKYELSVLNDCQIPPELEVEKSISCYFQSQLGKNIGFLVGLLEFRREVEEQEFNKYKFYRNLTEQLFHSISQLGEEIKTYPNKLEMIKNKEDHLNNVKRQIEENYQKLNKLITILREQIDNLCQKLQQKSSTLQKLQQKKIQSDKQFQQNFKKSHTKLDNMSVQDHSKFKPTPDNELTNNIYNLISTLIKWQPGKLKKVPTSKLEAIIKDRNFKWDKYRDGVRKILVSWKNAKRKNQKIGGIFLGLVDWVEGVQIYLFRNYQENEKLHAGIDKLEKQISAINTQIQSLKSKLIQKQEQTCQYQQLLKQNEDNKKQLSQLLQLVKTRQERIEIILKQIAEKQQKIKISKDLAERLYFLPKIIMSKSITQMALNQYEDDYFIANKLFLRSNRSIERERSGQRQRQRERERERDREGRLEDGSQVKEIRALRDVRDCDLFKYDVPLFQNIFDDFEAVLEVYGKYNLVDLDYDQVKLIQTIIASKQRVQIIQDMHDLIGSNLLQIFSNFLGYKLLNLSNSQLSTIKKQLTQKSKTYPKIILQLSRFDKPFQTKKLLQLLIHQITEHESLKIVIICKKFECAHPTDRFREISDRKVTLTYRKYLRLYAKILYEKEIVNQWDLYPIYNVYSKSHKMLFQVFEKFVPENDDSFNRTMEVIKNFQDARQNREKAFEVLEEYYEDLTKISLEFGPFYILLKYIEGIDRLNPIQLFEEGNILKNYQQILKKVVAEMYGEQQDRKKENILQKFIVYISNVINFVDEEQANQYCMISAFLLLKPKSVTPYFIIKLLQKAQKCKKPSQRIQAIIKEVSHRDIPLNTIQKLLSSKNLQQICEPWLEYLIFATSSNYQHYFQAFMGKIADTGIADLVGRIKNRSYSLDSHYYISKAKLDFKNQFKLTTCRQRACKFFWLIKVKREHVQKFMDVLENRVNILREGIKLVTFFFNESKYEANFQRLAQLSQKKIFICIFNISKEKANIIDQIISQLQQRTKSMHQMFKIFFLTQQSTSIKNRQLIDYIAFIPPNQPSTQQKMQKIVQDQISHPNKTNPKQQNVENNLLILNSLHVIIEKCTNKMMICREKDRIYGFLFEQLLGAVLFKKDYNGIKFIVEYFRVAKVSPEEVMEFCKIKEPLLVFKNKQTKLNKVEIQPSSDTLSRWVSLLQKLQQSPNIQQKYKKIIHKYSQSIIQTLIKGCPSRTVLNQPQIKNLIKYGWVNIENPTTLKFLLYKGLQQCLKKQSQDYNCEIISDLKLVCETQGSGGGGGKRIQFKFLEFNTLFSAENIVKEIQLNVRIVQEKNDQPLLDRTEIQYILQHFNMRISLSDEKDVLGKLYLTFK